MMMCRAEATLRYTALGLALAGLVTLSGCGGGGGGGGDSSDGPSSPTGDTTIAVSDLQGTWGGTVESPGTGGFATLEVQIDSAGDIAGVFVNGMDQGITGSLQGKTTASGQVFAYSLDGDDMALYVGPDATHAGLLLADGTVGVMQKATTSGTFNADDASGTWSGNSVYVVAPFEADGFDSVTGTFTSASGSVESSNVTFTNDTSQCSDAQVSLSGFLSSYGVYDSGTATGGTGADCPGADMIPADAYMSYDGQFMVLYAGCEATSTVDGCSFAILSRDGDATGAADGTDSTLTPTADGAAFQVNTTTALQQLDPAIAVLSGGGFVVAWEDFVQGVVARQYDATGSAASGEFVVGDGGNPAATSLAGGGVVVTHDGADASGVADGVLGQRYDSSLAAAGGAFQVNTYTSDTQNRSSVADLAGGGFVATWHSNGQDGDAGGVYAQRYDASGAPAGSELHVSTETVHDQIWPSVAGLSGGGFVIAWESLLQNGESTGIYAQRYDAAGNPVGGEFQVNNEVLSSSLGGFTPEIAALGDGGFVVSWHNGSSDVIFARRFDSTGSAAGGQFQVNTTDAINSIRPAATALANGGFVIVWKATKDGQWTVYGQRYDSSGAAAGNEFEIPEALNDFGYYDSSPVLEGHPSGGFVVAWVGNETGDGGVMARLFSVDGSGGSSGGGSGSTVSDFSGDWTGTATQTSNCGDDGTQTGTITITQSDSSIEVFGLTPSGSFSGTVSGDTASADGPFSYPEDGGTTTVTNWSVTLTGTDSFAGSSEFSWTDGTLSCSGTTSLSATRG